MILSPANASPAGCRAAERQRLCAASTCRSPKHSDRQSDGCYTPSSGPLPFNKLIAIMELSQVAVNAVVSALTAVVVALVTHLLTRAQDRQKYEREVAEKRAEHEREVAEKRTEHERDVAAKVAALNSVDPSRTRIGALQFAVGCFKVEIAGEGKREPVFLPLGSRITLGRSAENHIRIDEPYISLTHAAFRSVMGQVFVEPLAPSNGLEVNGKVVDKPRILATGDMITVPGASMKVNFVRLVSDGDSERF